MPPSWDSVGFIDINEFLNPEQASRRLTDNQKIAEKLLIDADDSIIAVSSGGNIQAVLSYTEI